MGAHDTEGRWWSLLEIMDAYGGFAFDTTTPVYIARFGTDQEPPLTELVNGRCQHCREGGES